MSNKIIYARLLSCPAPLTFSRGAHGSAGLTALLMALHRHTAQYLTPELKP